MGPILIAIDEGHVATAALPPREGLVCSADSGQWPCATMLAARKEQLRYAERLNQRDRRGTTWPIAVTVR